MIAFFFLNRRNVTKFESYCDLVVALTVCVLIPPSIKHQFRHFNTFDMVWGSVYILIVCFSI